MIPIDRLKEEIKIEDILKRHGHSTGRNNRCRCPVHQGNNTTAFSYSDKGFQCFTCGIHGDCIELEKLLSGCSFKEAIENLANDYGIKKSKARPQEWRKRQAEKKKIAEKQRAEKERFNQVYLAIAESHAKLMRFGAAPEVLQELEDWLDENIDY